MFILTKFLICKYLKKWVGYQSNFLLRWSNEAKTLSIYKSLTVASPFLFQIEKLMSDRKGWKAWLWQMGAKIEVLVQLNVFFNLIPHPQWVFCYKPNSFKWSSTSLSSIKQCRKRGTGDVLFNSQPCWGGIIRLCGISSVPIHKCSCISWSIIMLKYGERQSTQFFWLAKMFLVYAVCFVSPNESHYNWI